MRNQNGGRSPIIACSFIKSFLSFPSAFFRARARACVCVCVCVVVEVINNSGVIGSLKGDNLISDSTNELVE